MLSFKDSFLFAERSLENMLNPALASGILYLISVKIVIALPCFSLGFLLSARPVPLLAGVFGTLSFLLELSSVNPLSRNLFLCV